MILFLACTLSLTGLAQEATRSRQVPGLRPYDVDLTVMTREENDSVRMVAELWRNYVESFSKAPADDPDRRNMWVNGSDDYLAEFDDGVLLYSSFRENRLLDIRKIGPGAYEIVVGTSSKLPGEELNGWIECVYRVCALNVADSGDREYNPFRLRNWLDAVLPILPKTTIGNIDFYCSPGCDVPESVGEETADFVAALCREYGFEHRKRLRYVVAATVDQCEHLSGYLFNAYSNPLMNSMTVKPADVRFYGRLFGQSTILTNYFDDHRDLCLLIVRSQYPKAMQMLQDGFGFFHGGYMSHSYETVKSCLKDYLSEHENIDFSEEDLFYDLTMPLKIGESEVVVPIEGLLGSLFIEYGWKNGGPKLVRKMLSCQDYPELLKVVGVEKEAAGNFIKKLL